MHGRERSPLSSTLFIILFSRHHCSMSCSSAGNERFISTSVNIAPSLPVTIWHSKTLLPPGDEALYCPSVPPLLALELVVVDSALSVRCHHISTRITAGETGSPTALVQ